MAGKIDGYTVALARSTDESVIADAVGTIRTAIRSHAGKGESIMRAAAYATRAALAAEVETKKSLSQKWGTKDKDLSLSTITLYDRLGRAAILGVEPDGITFLDSGRTVWSLLAGRGAATISKVGQYIEKGPVIGYTDEGKPKYDKEHGEPTLDGLLDLLTDYFGPDGLPLDSKTRTANAAKRVVAEGGPAPVEDTEDETPEDEDMGGTRTLDEKFRTACMLVTSLAAQMDESVWKATTADRDAMWTALDKAHEAFTPKKRTAKKSA